MTGMVPPPAPRPSRSRLPRILEWPLIAVALVFVLLESTLWRWLSALGGLLGRLPFFAALERLVDRLSPGWVMVVVVAPFVPIIPLLKLGEIWLLVNGHYVSAALVIVGAKVVGAAFSTRVFAIARPKLLQIRWFAWLYNEVSRLLEIGHRTLNAIPAWVRTRERAREAVVQIKALWRAFRLRLMTGERGTVARKWTAALRWVRSRRSI